MFSPPTLVSPYEDTESDFTERKLSKSLICSPLSRCSNSSAGSDQIGALRRICSSPSHFSHGDVMILKPAKNKPGNRKHLTTSTFIYLFQFINQHILHA